MAWNERTMVFDFGLLKNKTLKLFISAKAQESDSDSSTESEGDLGKHYLRKISIRMIKF